LSQQCQGIILLYLSISGLSIKNAHSRAECMLNVIMLELGNIKWLLTMNYSSASIIANPEIMSRVALWITLSLDFNSAVCFNEKRYVRMD